MSIRRCQNDNFANFANMPCHVVVLGSIDLIFYPSVGNLTTNITVLQRHKPLIKVMEFVGQSGGTSGKKGLTQKEQIEVVRRFKEGGFNTLVATCVGEEGLDIGEVDLIVCYDVSKSPIRYLPYQNQFNI